MKDLKGTKTAINLMKAFAGESQAATGIPFMHQWLIKRALSR